MSRTSIIALLIFGAILGYFLSFGSETTRKFQASIYQMLSPFFRSGSGLEKQITSVRTGLKSLDELERENARLKKMVAEQALDIDMLKELARGNW